MHTYIHTCMHACIHTYMHAYIHSYIHSYLSIYECMGPRVFYGLALSLILWYRTGRSIVTIPPIASTLKRPAMQINSLYPTQIGPQQNLVSGKGSKVSRPSPFRSKSTLGPKHYAYKNVQHLDHAIWVAGPSLGRRLDCRRRRSAGRLPVPEPVPDPPGRGKQPALQRNGPKSPCAYYIGIAPTRR